MTKEQQKMNEFLTNKLGDLNENKEKIKEMERKMDVNDLYPVDVLSLVTLKLKTDLLEDFIDYYQSGREVYSYNYENIKSGSNVIHFPFDKKGDK